MQTMNVARNAWPAAGLPLEVAATTVDAQCGSSQQATNLAYAMVKSGVVDSAVSCGIELMSAIKMGATIPDAETTGVPVNARYWENYEWTSQFEGAERIAHERRLAAPARCALSAGQIAFGAHDVLPVAGEGDAAA